MRKIQHRCKVPPGSYLTNRKRGNRDRDRKQTSARTSPLTISCIIDLVISIIFTSKAATLTAFSGKWGNFSGQNRQPAFLTQGKTIVN